MNTKPTWPPFDWCYLQLLSAFSAYPSHSRSSDTRPAQSPAVTVSSRRAPSCAMSGRARQDGMEESQVISLRPDRQERETIGPGRATFSNELKREVVALLNSHGWGYRRVSKAMGLSESSLHRWAEKFSPHGKNPRGTGGPNSRRPKRSSKTIRRYPFDGSRS